MMTGWLRTPLILLKLKSEREKLRKIERRSLKKDDRLAQNSTNSSKSPGAT